MHGSVVRPYPLLPPIPIVVLRGGIERTTTAHATAFEGSGFGGSRFDSRGPHPFEMGSSALGCTCAMCCGHAVCGH